MLLLIPCLSVAQDLDCLKSKDTLYLVIDITEDTVVKQYKDFSIRSYGHPDFNVIDFNYKPYKSVNFICEKNKKSRYKVKRKGFLKDHNVDIINISFIESIGLNGFRALVDNGKRKTILIIDKDDLEKRKITIHQSIITFIGDEM